MAPLSTRSRPAGIERFIPRRELLPFVDLIWQYKGLVRAHDLERVLPTGTMSIIINLADDTSRKALRPTRAGSSASPAVSSAGLTAPTS